MADPLFQNLLSKASGIGPAPPIGGQGVRTAIDGGMDLLRGATGVGDQGPAGPTSTNLGNLLAAGAPAITGGKAVEELLKLLEGFKPAEEAAHTALGAARATPRTPFPPSSLKLPQGVYAPPEQLAIPAREGYDQWKAAFGPKPKGPEAPVQTINSLDQLHDITSGAVPHVVAPPDTFGNRASGPALVMSKLRTLKANPEMVRDIRKIADFNKALEVYPELNPNTLKGILRGDTWGWVK